MTYRCGKYSLDLSRPLVMGIVNVTPDSFSDGGRYASTRLAVEHALQMVEEGADMLDIGGESTRPGAEPVPLDEELRRVIPVIEALAAQTDIPLSIDTYKAQVMAESIAAGASLVNDVSALQGPGAMEVVAASNAGVCLMHMSGTPQTMQNDPQYVDAVKEIKEFLLDRADRCLQAGITQDRIMLDPGFGFGKRSIHNVALLRELEQFCASGYPVLVGISRKSILGQITGNSVADRLPASLAAAVIAAMKGAAVVRVHDVRVTREALAVVSAVVAPQEK